MIKLESQRDRAATANFDKFTFPYRDSNRVPGVERTAVTAHGNVVRPSNGMATL